VLARSAVCRSGVGFGGPSVACRRRADVYWIYEWFHMTAHVNVSKKRGLERYVTTLHKPAPISAISVNGFTSAPAGEVIESRDGDINQPEALKHQHGSKFISRTLGCVPMTKGWSRGLSPPAGTDRFCRRNTNLVRGQRSHAQQSSKPLRVVMLVWGDFRILIPPRYSLCPKVHEVAKNG